MNSYYSLLMNDTGFACEEGLFYQKEFSRSNSFEQSYLQLREKEGRLYSDSVVRLLPEFEGPVNLSTEWKIRRKSAIRLIDHLKQRRPERIIEIGCGNGWLIHHLQKQISADYLGIDINEPELKQATRVSKNNSSCFLYGDILSDSMNVLRADIIIVASAAQYFPDLKPVVQRLLSLLTPNGEVHIIDSPFYTDEKVKEAESRSDNYFREMQVDKNRMSYYHHTLAALESLNYGIVYQPQSLINRLKRKMINDSPFPWIIITN